MSVEELSVELAAEACGVPAAAIWDLLDSGRLPGSYTPEQNLPDGWLIVVDDLRAAGLTPDELWLHEHGQWDDEP